MIAAPGRPRRVLLVALDNLGDLVFASALTPPLHEAFPDATIDVWCKQYTAPVAPLIPHVGDVIAANTLWAVPQHLERGTLLTFLRSLAAVRRKRYDVAIVTGAPWRTCAAVAATGIPVRIGHARNHNDRFLTHVVRAADASRPVLEEQARLLEPLGLRCSQPRYRLDASRIDGVREAVRAKLPERFVALHPFASDPARCVPLAEWLALAAQLETRGLAILWVGMPSELAGVRRLERTRGHAFADQLGGTLLESSAALSIASLFVGHDSGPLHVAGAFGVPVVGVFAPGQPLRTFPQGVGPSAMISRPSPDGITADVILTEIDALFSAA